MKIFRFLAIALVAMLGFTACEKHECAECDHNFIEYDYSNALVGTWTYDEGEQAEAIVIKNDGSFTITGVMKHGALYEEKGTIKVENNKVSLVFEGETEAIEGRLELVAGKSMSIVINEQYGVRLDYDYCENDLSDEIVGMWVCMDTPADGESEMMIETFYDNGKSTLTGFLPLEGNSEQVKNEATDYMVIGDLLFISIPADKFGDGTPFYVVHKMIYTPNATAMGDIITMKSIAKVGDEYLAGTSSWLRVKQYLNLDNKVYDYSSAYVTNVKGKDEDFSILGNTLNLAKIEAKDFDMMFRSVLSCFEFDDNTMKYKFRRDDGFEMEFDTRIATVDGNKVTLDMSSVNPACRKVDMHMFQDADDSQLHLYMHTDAFINYFANLEVIASIMEGKINQTDAAAVEKVFTDMEARVESINVSFVLKARK